MRREARVMRVWFGVGALLVGLALPVVASAQSLFRENGPGASLFVDRRARAVNDIVTILIVEQSSSSRTANTDVTKESTLKAGVSNFPTIFDPITKLAKPLTKPLFGNKATSNVLKDGLNVDISGAMDHAGKGTIDRSDKVTGQIAARVVRVQDNGNLLIEGRRSVIVNDETQIITISGIVRPDDVTGVNTVLSSQIADAEVQMVGKGVIADAQRPGVLYRLLSWLSLF
jgi:flagellar L-ring protein precursor FlgH